jgi:endonuclease G, mitochondrial
MTMKKTALIFLLIGFILGIAFEFAFQTYLWPNRHLTYTWLYTLRNYKEPGEPCKTDLVLDRQGYSLGYSYKYKNALWVAYIISAGSAGIESGRYGNFYADTAIPEEYRTKLEDYLNIGYDKGHLAPSATIDFSKSANRETFMLSNITMQDATLNRQGWEKLEELEREWTKTKGKLYVVAGPLFSSRPQKMNGIAIPAKYYKVIYAYRADQAIGFIFPNKPVTKDAIWDYAISVQDVEKESKLTFFSNFSAQKQQQLKETLELPWWQNN